MSRREWVVFAFIAAVFGGALLASAPASANPGDVTCFVEVTPDPSATPAPTSPPVVPTACPTATIPVTKTVTAVVTTTKTIFVDKPVVTTVTATQPVPTTSSTPTPTPTPTVLWPTVDAQGSGWKLSSFNAAVAGVLGGAGTAIVVMGIVRKRRYQGAHAASDDEVLEQEEGFEDYDPNYDPGLGGYAGESNHDQTETMEIPAVDDDTRVIPPVE